MLILDDSPKLLHDLAMVETKIAPGFLVAAPQLRDPNFESTVILMLDHDDDEGSMGLVINRTASVKLDLVLGEMKVKTPNPFDISGHPPLLYGGPVSPERGWILDFADGEGWEVPLAAIEGG